MTASAAPEVQVGSLLLRAPVMVASGTAGHGAELVTKAAKEWDDTIEVVLQAEQKGTGHAVDQARAALADFDGDVIVLYGDTPFIRPETLEAMVNARRTADVVVLGFEAKDPGRYGRLVMQGQSLERIVEFKDASPEERAITLSNSGVICANRETLFDLISAIDNKNASGEYYLTDIVGLANAKGLKATAVTCDESETLGINSRAELAMAEAAYQSRARSEAQENGVTLISPETVHFAHDTLLGRDAIIEQFVVFGPGVTVESDAVIRAFSHLEGCHVGQGAIVGPYARLRPGAELGDEAHVGNFVEIKNAILGTGAKANHLTYIGDADVGEKTNIGAGTITCNYDGVMKHRTTIGARAFIGSNTMLVAPVTVGNDAMTGSGAVITKNVPDGALAVARAPQENKPGAALRLLEMLKAKKAKRIKKD
ncbi:MAG: bifunctional UDP-N-acetylglucosamine diphosphorylase/glucosamine-1-phosphate N-acetyltransferase GlmU [Rhodobacteraceae bacterium]|nr:bifunctional UDP-N-acetylglucosamine diphosphorylase/glucosamine-1-phosphate N-acetyltransferase GlmU [Paracoccaceae bacterium]